MNMIYGMLFICFYLFCSYWNFDFYVIFFKMMEIAIFFKLYYFQLFSKIWANYIVVVINYIVETLHLTELTSVFTVNIFFFTLSLMMCSSVGLAMTYLHMDSSNRLEDWWVMFALLYYVVFSLMVIYSIDINLFFLGYVFLNMFSYFLLHFFFKESYMMENSIWFFLMKKITDICLLILVFFFLYFNDTVSFIMDEQYNPNFFSENPTFFFYGYSVMDMMALLVVFFSFLMMIQFSFYFVFFKEKNFTYSILPLIYFLGLLTPGMMMLNKMYMFIELSLISQKFAAFLMFFFIFWFCIHISAYKSSRRQLCYALELYLTFLMGVYLLNLIFSMNIMFTVFFAMKLILFLSVCAVMYQFFFYNNFKPLKKLWLYEILLMFSFFMVAYSFMGLFFYLSFFSFQRNYEFLLLDLTYICLTSCYVVLFFMTIFVFYHFFYHIFFFIFLSKSADWKKKFLKEFELTFDVEDLFFFILMMNMMFVFDNFIFCDYNFNIENSIVFKASAYLLGLDYYTIGRYVVGFLMNMWIMSIWYNVWKVCGYKDKKQFILMTLISLFLFNFIFFGQIWPPK